MNFWLFILPTFSFLLSLLITKVVHSYAIKQSLIDIPNERSSHLQPTPRGGGLGFILAFFITLILAKFVTQLGFSSDLFLPLVLLPLVIIGFLDDRYNLPSILRYAIQFGTGLIALWHYGSFPVPWLTNFGLFGIILGMGLTVIGFTALVNFYNFMDGLDGFVTTVTVIQLSFIALYLQQPIWWLLIAALLGFLCWNWPPAKIFMGDVGSTALGAVIAIALIQSPDATLAWSSLAITLPITGDTIYTLIVRLSRGENIFQAHRTHIFQRLHQSGFSHSQVTLIYALLTLVIAFLITNFSALGAIASLLLTTLMILGAELYLKHSEKTETIAT